MVLPNQKQGHHVFYCINKAVSRGDSLISDLIIALQNYVDAFYVECSERARNDGRSLCAEIVCVEDDVVAVLIFESLLGLKSFAENVGGDEVGSECAYCICEVGVEVDLVGDLAFQQIEFFDRHRIRDLDMHRTDEHVGAVVVQHQIIHAGNFLKFEYKRTVGEKTWRGFVRKTVRNGYTIMLDYQTFDRLPRRTDEDALNKIANTISFEVKDPMQVAQQAAQQADNGEDGTAQSFEEISALKAGMINISVYPPDQTNSSTFTVEGTSTPGGVVTVVGMRIAKTEAHRFNAEVTSKGNFKVNVTLPEEGVWNFTIGLEADGKTYPYENVKQTEYYASLLPVTLDTQFPAELTSDEMTISGTTDKGVTVQCIVQCNGSAILNKQIKTNGTGTFKFKVSTAVEGSYDFVLSFQKKGLNNVRKSFTSTRTLTAADNQARANTKAIHPAYKALMNNMDSYIGKTMVYSVHIVNVTNNTDQWVIQAALKKNRGTYSNFVYYIADTDPGLEPGTKVKAPLVGSM